MKSYFSNCICFGLNAIPSTSTMTSLFIPCVVCWPLNSFPVLFHFRLHFSRILKFTFLAPISPNGHCPHWIVRRIVGRSFPRFPAHHGICWQPWHFIWVGTAFAAVPKHQWICGAPISSNSGTSTTNLPDAMFVTFFWFFEIAFSVPVKCPVCGRVFKLTQKGNLLAHVGMSLRKRKEWRKIKQKN